MTGSGNLTLDVCKESMMIKDDFLLLTFCKLLLLLTVFRRLFYLLSRPRRQEWQEEGLEPQNQQCKLGRRQGNVKRGAILQEHDGIWPIGLQMQILFVN